MSDFLNQKYSKANKIHKCEFCEKEIVKGEKYSYESGVYDGDFFTRKLCLECYDMMNTFCRENNENEFSWDWIEDWICDKYCYGCPNKDDCELIPKQCEIVRGEFGASGC